MMRLHCFGESGHSYKVALALELSGLPWEPVHLDFFNGAGRRPEYISDVNEMGEAPVLVHESLVKFGGHGVLLHEAAMLILRHRLVFV